MALRRLGQEYGLKINEYGVFRGETRNAGETEEFVYASVGLPWIPQELREDRGEIEAARGAGLPALISRTDLRGDLHTHTVASDGVRPTEKSGCQSGTRASSNRQQRCHCTRAAQKAALLCACLGSRAADQGSRSVAPNLCGLNRSVSARKARRGCN